METLRYSLGRVLTPLFASLLRALRFVGKLGFGRQGALAATRRVFPARAHTPARRAVSLVVGSLMLGTGVALLTQANLGLSPYDVLVSGLQPRLGFSFGQTVWAISGALFLVAAILGRRPSRWGIAFVVAIGFAIDAVSGSINSPESLAGRWTFVFAAIALVSAGLSLVVHSGNTGGSFELLMLAGEDRGFDRRTVRTSLEFGALVTGIVLGGGFGPATVAVALFIGPVIGAMSTALEDHSRGRQMRLDARQQHAPAERATASATN